MDGTTCSQTVGPFFHTLLRAGWSDLVRSETRGERIRLEGRVFDGDGTPVPDAMIEIWQANDEGRYDHPADTQGQSSESAFHGFGRSGTDDKGRFRFHTIKPGPVPGRGEALQSPHIGVIIFARGLLNHLYTRIYFPDEPMNETDAWLRAVPETRRQTLIARREAEGSPQVYHFDIVLQGENETVFFDVWLLDP